MSCTYQTICLHIDDVQLIPLIEVAAAVNRKISALPKLGHIIFQGAYLSSVSSRPNKVPTQLLFWKKRVSPKGSGQVPNKNSNLAAVIAYSASKRPRHAFFSLFFYYNSTKKHYIDHIWYLSSNISE